MNEHEKTPWEREILEKLVLASTKEQRSSRRWSIFFKLLFFTYIFGLLFWFSPKPMTEVSTATGPHVALIDLRGEIADEEEANAESLISVLQDAFENNNSKGIILRINSPGGSPVQSQEVFTEIRRLRQAHPTKKIYAVATDMCTSGAYYIAAATDAIYANPSSLVGSIGVLMNGFGFVGAIEKLGIERRLLTAGNNKALLDPFSPLQVDQQLHVQNMLDDIHQQFISDVKLGRGKRLKEDPQIFSGLFWTGRQAVSLGLVDGLGTVDEVANSVIGVQKVVNYTPQKPWFENLVEQFGTAVGGKVGLNNLYPHLS